MIFLYDKKTNEVKAISDKEIKVSNPNFKTKELTATKQQKEEIHKGYKLKIVKGKLKTEKNADIIEKEKEDELKSLKEKAKEGKLSNKEIQQILSNLI